MYAILIELLGGILTPIIRSKCPNPPPSLVLHKRFELLMEPLQELLRYLTPQEVDPNIPGMIIDECHIILESSQRNN